jgi:glycosyltransferase involved in cell wall biosynthesis
MEMATKNPLKVLHLSHSDLSGGAARAAYRIHRALRSIGIDSLLGVNLKLSDDWTVIAPTTFKSRLMINIKSAIATQIRHLFSTQNNTLHSFAVFNSLWPEYINQSDYSVVHLHWIGHEMLSIQDIKRIKKPIVWTFHDMWPYCGAEHYATDLRWNFSYEKATRPNDEMGFDLNRWTWLRKRKYWVKKISVVTPSNWLASDVKKSSLMSDWPVSVIHYPIDVESWTSVDKNLARDLFKLPRSVPLALFGAMGGSKDHRKGFDLLIDSLNELYKAGLYPDLQLVIFGESSPKNPINLKFPVNYVGALNDELSLRVLYSAADVMLVPSRQDNLPLTAIESSVCGTPVVAYSIGGMPDLIDHEVTGYLAKPYNYIDYSDGIRWALNQRFNNDIRTKVRQIAVKKFNPKKIAAEYQDVYEAVLANNLQI